MLLSLLVLTIGLMGISATQPSNQTTTCTHQAKKPAICLEVGGLDSLDKELHREEAKKPGFIFVKKDETIVFPPGGQSSNWFTLTSINVTNLMPKGKEGLVTLKEGGVGHQNVTLYVESQRGEGYHFLIVIRGKDSEFKNNLQLKPKQK